MEVLQVAAKQVRVCAREYMRCEDTAFTARDAIGFSIFIHIVLIFFTKLNEIVFIFGILFGWGKIFGNANNICIIWHDICIDKSVLLILSIIDENFFSLIII